MEYLNNPPIRDVSNGAGSIRSVLVIDNNTLSTHEVMSVLKNFTSN